MFQKNLKRTLIFYTPMSYLQVIVVVASSMFIFIFLQYPNRRFRILGSKKGTKTLDIFKTSRHSFKIPFEINKKYISMRIRTSMK